jgi:hypothetical protein
VYVEREVIIRFHREVTLTLSITSSQIHPDDTDTCIACTTSNGDIEEGGHNFKI